MSIVINFQIVSNHHGIPTKKLMRTWLQSVLKRYRYADMTLRIINRAESARLNQYYRQKIGATNVLSFTYAKKPLWGDILLCAPLIATEARQQRKTLSSHWAHLIIHGALHLLGYDHQQAQDADRMEKKEIILLKQQGFANPYED